MSATVFYIASTQLNLLLQERQQLPKSVGAKQSYKMYFYCKNLSSYGYLMKSVQATAPTAPLIPAPVC